MKDGQVLEMGPPQELLQDNFSNFRAMAIDAGISINQLERKEIFFVIIAAVIYPENTVTFFKRLN